MPKTIQAPQRHQCDAAVLSRQNSGTVTHQRHSNGAKHATDSTAAEVHLKVPSGLYSGPGNYSGTSAAESRVPPLDRHKTKTRRRNREINAAGPEDNSHSATADDKDCTAPTPRHHHQRVARQCIRVQQQQQQRSLLVTTAATQLNSRRTSLQRGTTA